MTLVIKSNDLNERVGHVAVNANCVGVTCDSHDGCGEQCSHERCRY